MGGGGGGAFEYALINFINPCGEWREEKKKRGQGSQIVVME